MTYCDTSFLASLYLKADANHAPAMKAAARFQESIPLSLLAELELTNALRRAAELNVLSKKELADALDQIERDIQDGYLERKPVNQADQYKLAMELSRRRAALLVRSLDILHVATALLSGAKVFASFDSRQRALAQAEGLSVIPK